MTQWKSFKSKWKSLQKEWKSLQMNEFNFSEEQVETKELSLI